MVSARCLLMESQSRCTTPLGCTSSHHKVRKLSLSFIYMALWIALDLSQAECLVFETGDRSVVLHWNSFWPSSYSTTLWYLEAIELTNACAAGHVSLSDSINGRVTVLNHVMSHTEAEVHLSDLILEQERHDSYQVREQKIEQLTKGLLSKVRLRGLI